VKQGEDEKKETDNQVHKTNENLLKITEMQLYIPADTNFDATGGFSRNNRGDDTMLRLNATNLNGISTHFEDFRNQDELVDEYTAIPEINEEEDIEVPQESKVGKKLSDLTTKRTIILVLAMLFSVPLFSDSTYL
jgi:preprotein translocase subunit SecF